MSTTSRKYTGFESTFVLGKVAGRQAFVTVMLTLSLANIYVQADIADQLWVESLTQNACGGTYDLEKLVFEPVELQNDATLVGRADKVVISLDGKSDLQGDVSVQIGETQIKAPTLELEAEGRIFRSPEGVSVLSGDIAISANQSDIQLIDEKYDIRDLSFVLTGRGYRGSATRFRGDLNQVTLQDVALTQCPPNVRSWGLSVGQLELNRSNNVAEIRRAKLSLFRMPIFYLPYWRFPLVMARTSGVLLPSLASNSLRGQEISVPVYFNLAPNYDATLTPKFSSRRTHSIEFEFRHLSRSSSSQLMSVNLPSDVQYQRFLASRIDRNSTLTGSRSNRWLLDMNHASAIQGWRMNAHYSIVSDSDYLRDFGQSIDELGRVGLRRHAELRWSNRNGELSVTTERYDPFRNWGSSIENLPEIAMSWRKPFGKLRFDASGNLAYRNATDIEGRTTSDRRSHADFSVTLPFVQSWGFLRLTGMSSISQFDLQGSSSLDRDFHTLALDTGLFFDRNVSIGQERFMQSLEPRIHYVKRNSGSQRDFPALDNANPTLDFVGYARRDRRVGLDRIEPIDSLSFLVFSKVRHARSLRELMSLQLAFVKNFETSMPYDQRSPRGEHQSGVGLQFTSNINEHVASYVYLFDSPSRQYEDTYGIGIGYNKEETEIVFRYRELAKSGIRQSYLSTNFPINEKWTLYSRWHFDWGDATNSHIESFAGFKYSGCCIDLRLLWRKTVRYEHVLVEKVQFKTGIHLEISLKGLTSLGDNVQSIVRTGFPWTVFQ